jgi:hypothetical protein
MSVEYRLQFAFIVDRLSDREKQHQVKHSLAALFFMEQLEIKNVPRNYHA